MSSLNGRSVRIARLHSVTHVPNVGQFGPVVEAGPGKHAANVSMVKEADGVLVTGMSKGLPFELFISSGNIISLILEPETLQLEAVRKATAV